MQLYNNLSNNERADLIKKAGKDRLTISFYKYAKIGNPELLRNHLFIFWNSIDVLGRIYVAHEGINAQATIFSDDDSADFEKTDLFIEKSIAASFELAHTKPLKSVVDFGKFLFKEKIGSH